MSSQQGLWIVIPTYNERENMVPLTDAIKRAVPSVATILIVDDGSPDGTAVVAAQIPGVRVLSRTGPRGYGYAMRDGLLLAYREGAEVIVTMDADLSHDPSILPQLVAGLEQADLVIGSRYCQGAALVKDWSWQRLLISKIATTLITTCTGARVSDATSSYRCWSRELLGTVPLEELTGSGFAFSYECLFQAHRHGARLAEVPNVYRGRTYGESKLDWTVAIEATLRLPGLLLRRIGGRKGNQLWRVRSASALTSS